MKRLFFAYLVSMSFLYAGASVQTPPQAVDTAKLTRLIERGKETGSDAVIVTQDGKSLAEEYYGNRKAQFIYLRRDNS